jgi:hypothetical protein
VASCLFELSQSSLYRLLSASLHYCVTAIQGLMLRVNFHIIKTVSQNMKAAIAARSWDSALDVWYRHRVSDSCRMLMFALVR